MNDHERMDMMTETRRVWCGATCSLVTGVVVEAPSLLVVIDMPRNYICRRSIGRLEDISDGLE